MDKEEREIKWKSRSLQALYLSGGQSCHLADGFDRQVQCLHPSGIRLLLFHTTFGKTFLTALGKTFLATFGKAFLGAKEGQEVVVEAPFGNIRYTVKKIER